MQSTPAPMLDNQQLENLVLHREGDDQIAYVSMDVHPRPCFTWNLVRDLLTFQRRFADITRLDVAHPRVLVYASMTPGVFSLGGDLNLFRNAIETRDRTLLTRYIEDCACALHNLATTPDTVTVGLLEGDALGAGLETALACDIVIAERGIRAGYPEVLFNLIPGAGGFHLAARRIGPRAAEQLVRQGGLLSAEDLYAMGLVDVLVEKGEGRGAVRELLDTNRRSWNTYHALQLVKRQYQPITRELLLANAAIWVDAAMRLTERNLRMMERLVHAQEKRTFAPAPAPVTQPMEERAAA